jgi:mono/diheme cytochrome c family protein
MAEWNEGKRLAAGMAMIAGLAVAGAALAQGIGDSSGSGHGAATSSGGEQVYREICQACHMAHAEGGKGAGNVPALASNPHLADPDFALNRVLRGQGGMPAFASMLTPEQVAGVVGYIRTHFGNDYPKPVTVEDVKRLSAGLETSE